MDEQYSLDADSLMFHQPFVSIRVNKIANAGALRWRFALALNGLIHINNIELNSYSEQGLPGSNWFQNPNAVAFIQRPHS
ncbi:TPA: hypothetical protein QDA23_000615 [Escherichia coli]|nr:hypothetical protein [Escherichia coli]